MYFMSHPRNSSYRGHGSRCQHESHSNSKLFLCTFLQTIWHYIASAVKLCMIVYWHCLIRPADTPVLNQSKWIESHDECVGPEKKRDSRSPERLLYNWTRCQVECCWGHFLDVVRTVVTLSAPPPHTHTYTRYESLWQPPPGPVPH